ncbi:MAG TPA: hypothetical protein VND95_13400, partial [Stellaceae bacterium]|nr:hypothetical protein [Stellaceae bacterium]
VVDTNIAKFGSNTAGAATTTYDAGDKALFGDLGHNWINGGNGMADIYGGFGDDLLNAQRNLTLDSGKNDVPDNPILSNGVTFHSIVFGGAGRSTLIAGGVYDRLIDWKGEFNQYVVPFSPYGAPTISRDLNPALFQYLYQLSASDGADPTIATDWGQDATRNGEPYGELGLVTQVDPFWQEQGGAPNQAVAQGHIPGGSREIIGSAAFARGTLSTSGMLAVSGTFTVANGVLNATPPSVGTNSFATLDPNTQLPDYFELTTSVSAGKPTGGYKSNAYIIFDYQSPTNFKFAGIDESIDKIEIGHFDGTNWIIDAQTPAQIKFGTMYNLFLSLNGNYAYLIVNNQHAIGYTFPWNVVNGVNLGVGHGIVGLGANNSTSTFSDLVIQQPVPPTSFTYTETFTGGTAKYFDAPSSGTWAMASGSDTGTASTAQGAPSGGAAIQLIDIGEALGLPAGTVSLQAGATLDLKATLQTAGRAGIVYAYDNAGYYKFAALLADKQQVVLGHYTSKSGFVFDATVGYTITNGKNYTIEINANGNTVILSVNGNPLLSYAYNSVVTGGQFGIAVLSGHATFSQTSVFTDDSNFPTETIQHMYAAGAPTAPVLGDTALTTNELDSILGAAIDRLAAMLSLDAKQIAELWAAKIDIGSLPDDGLGITVGDTITISPDAAGWGWFVDPNPLTDSAFPLIAAGGLTAAPGSAAAGHMDLLTVEMHELAHILGYGDTSSGLMSEYLSPGLRLAPPVNGSPAAATTSAAIGAPVTPTLLDSADRPAAGVAPQSGGAQDVAVGYVVVAAGGLTSYAPIAVAPPPPAFGDLLLSSILVGPDLLPPVAAAPSNGLEGGFVSLGGGPNASSDTFAPPAGGPLGSADLPSPAPHHSDDKPPAGAKNGKPATIAWDSSGFGNADSLDGGLSGNSQDWLNDFLNHLGQDETLWNPNAGLRVRAGGDGAVT